MYSNGYAHLPNNKRASKHFFLKLYLLPTALFFVHNGSSFYRLFFVVFIIISFFWLSLHFNEYRLFYSFLLFFPSLIFPCGALVPLCSPIVCHPFFVQVRIASTRFEHYVVLCLNRFEWILAYSINLTLPYKFTFEGGFVRLFFAKHTLFKKNIHEYYYFYSMILLPFFFFGISIYFFFFLTGLFTSFFIFRYSVKNMRRVF